jgi:peptidoglycan hydrolase-like protein with peptidoglycan-binding domain/curli biogenesis system outer membrane secretion channel CsgG
MCKRFVKTIASSGVALAALAAVGCEPLPETAHTVVNPQTAPVRTITSFNDSLRCMDDLFLARGIKDVYITSAGVPDATGAIAAGTKEMLITAVAQMSAKSNAFHFVDYDPTQIDVQVLSEMVGLRKDFVAPSYYIRGAITQLDSGVLSSTNAAAISTPFLSLAASKDQVVSIISVDLNLGKLVTRQILGGMSSSNSIAVVRTGKGADVGGVIGKGGGQAGLTFSVALDKSEGLHQAVRNLIELSTIEILGKLTRVSYWQCLKIEQSNPTYRTEAREWFDTMSAQDRVKFVKANLTRAGYYQGPADSALDPGLRDAIARYQAEHDVVANGRIDFDLYYRLLGESRQEVTAAPAAPVAAPAPEPPATTSPAASAPPPTIQLQANKGGKAFRVNDSLVLNAVTSQDGFLYCYYQDAEGSIARIYPNRFQPDAFVHGGNAVEIPPGREKPFNIKLDKSHAKEAVACVASPLELGVKLPEALKKQDLEALPVRSLNDIIDSFRQLSGPLSEGWLAIEVM